MEDFKLVYFDLRGRAEMIRLMFAASGTPLNEDRVDLFKDWPALKPSTPYGVLPYIELRGQKYGESGAIARYVARELGFYGKTNLDALRIDEVMWLIKDQGQNLSASRFGATEEIKAEARRKMLDEDIPRYLATYRKLLLDNRSTGYFVGNALTLADFYIYDMVENVVQVVGGSVLDGYPLMRKLQQNVEAHPKVKQYLDRRPKTMY